jgi:hypothetical protein
MASCSGLWRTWNQSGSRNHRVKSSVNIGEVLGVAGFVLGILNYLRDRASIRVCLKFDMELYPPPGPSGTRYGVIIVTNAGRRPAFASAVALTVPYEGHGVRRLLSKPLYRFTPRIAARLLPTRWIILLRSTGGQKLIEGDQPYMQLIPQQTYEALSPYRLKWREIRAVIELSTGHRVFSAPADKQPSWANLQSPEERQECE